MNDERIQEIVRGAVPPLSRYEPRRDLWPLMRERLDKRDVRISWLDRVLLAAVALLLIFVPQLIPMLLYHL